MTAHFAKVQKLEYRVGEKSDIVEAAKRDGAERKLDGGLGVSGWGIGADSDQR